MSSVTIRFWGVRGSLPSPLLPSQIQEKIIYVVNHIQPKDIESPQAKKQFLAELPPWVFGTAGGNTTCISVLLDNAPDHCIVFDAGSGIRELGISMATVIEPPSRYSMLFSHFHWDHIMGLPFFDPAYDPTVHIDFYSPKPNIESILSKQMVQPYFPVTLDAFTAEKEFHQLTGSLLLENASIAFKKMNHPGDSYSYTVDDGRHRLLYATDTELLPSDFVKNNENRVVFQDIDLAIIDSQYTFEEALEKFNWGHNAFSLAIDFAVHWGMKHLVLFHHEPVYHDQKLYDIVAVSEEYIRLLNITGLRLTLATEELEIML
jgi:phosphoribosyl 1,2-cyclic phosphodiesterase